MKSAGTARTGALARGDAPPAVVSSPAATAPITEPGAVASPAPAAAPADTNNNAGFPIEGIAGLLAALGIAGAGAYAMTRRRADSEDEFVEDFASPEPEPTPAAMADPMALPANPPTRPAARLGPSAEALAAGPVPIGDDRAELLEAMVAAAPNEANPFTSRKARMRRARLILQHREHLQMQGKPFDWRTYRPTTGPSNPTPTKPLVEA